MNWGLWLWGESRRVGSIVDTGVVPQSRGKSYGGFLQRRAMKFMQEGGLKYFVSGTDVENIPQINHFKKTGCYKLGEFVDICIKSEK